MRASVAAFLPLLHRPPGLPHAPVPWRRPSRLFGALSSAREVTSTANPVVKLAKKLAKTSGKDGLALLEGRRLVGDALGAGLVPRHVLVNPAVLDDDGGALRRLLEAAPPSVDVLLAPPHVVAAASATQSPQGVVALLDVPAAPSALQPPPRLVLALDGVGDPGNLGTLLRTAAAVGADAAVLFNSCCSPWSTKALRAAMGATFRLPLFSAGSWAEADALLRGEWGLDVRVADYVDGAAAYDAADWRARSALVVGSEGNGISADLVSALGKGEPTLARVVVPMSNDVESLNAAVAGAVILGEAARQRRV